MADLSSIVLQDGNEYNLKDAEARGNLNINGLTDTNISNVTDEQVLSWDSASSKWINRTVSGGGGSGDMTKTVYDTNDDGVVNAADVASAVKFSKTGGDINVSFGVESGSYGYYDASGNFVDFKSQADIDSAVAAAKVGTATAGDVLSGKTFTNSTTSGVSGSMTNNGTESDILTTAHTSHTISEGYHNGNGVIRVDSQTKTGIILEPEETKTITGELNKFLSSVSVSGPAVDTSGNTFTAGTSQQSYGVGGTSCWTSVTINPTPSQPKSETLSPASSGTTLYPDSGKLLSSASFSISEHTDIYEPRERSQYNDMTARHTKRYVDTRYICDTYYNSGYSAGDSAGYSRGYSAGDSAGYSRGYSEGDSAGYTRGYGDGDWHGQAMGVTQGPQVFTPAWNISGTNLFLFHTAQAVSITGINVWTGYLTNTNSRLIMYANNWVERGRLMLIDGTGRMATPYRDVIAVQIYLYNDTDQDLNLTINFAVEYV